MDVISLLLRGHGLEDQLSKVKQVPINFFNNEDNAIKFLEDYYTHTKVNSRDLELSLIQVKSAVNSLKNIRNKRIKKCKTCIPETYLNSLFRYYYSLNPDIISCSFYTSALTNTCVPRFRRSRTNLIAATLNDPERALEDMMEVDGQAPSIEPLFSYFTNYSSIGCIIVGNNTTPGEYFGMYSRNGDRVTTLGHGTGWGTDDSCIQPADFGASYATPEIATKLFIAKAFWRSKGLDNIEANEARVRILLATDIQENFVGKFASGGSLRFEKLLKTSPAYCELTDGTITDVSILEDSEIRFADLTGGPIRRGPNCIPAVAFSNGSAYAFYESSLMWKKVIIRSIRLHIQKDGKEIILTDVPSVQTYPSAKVHIF